MKCVFTKLADQDNLNEYRVTWEMECSAINPTEAAQFALDCIKDVDSLAHFFDVVEYKGSTDKKYLVNLDNGTELPI